MYYMLCIKYCIIQLPKQDRAEIGEEAMIKYCSMCST